MFDLSLAETLRAASARLRALAGKATQSRKADYGWRYVEVDDMPPGQPSTTVTNCGWGGDDAVALPVLVPNMRGLERAAALGDETAKKALERLRCPYVIKDKRGGVVTNLCF